MKNKLEFYLESEGHFVFPDYQLDLTKYAQCAWEKNWSAFTFDLVSVEKGEKKGTNRIVLYFHLDKGTQFSEQTSHFFHDSKFRRFVLASIFREFKSCGLITGQTKIKIALNDVSENPLYINQIESFCREHDYLFCTDHLFAQTARAA